jgi:Acyl-CoA dehydrogenase, C-terminal domain
VTTAVPDAVGVLAELQRWIRASWDPELSLVRWRDLLADAGWAHKWYPQRAGRPDLVAGRAIAHGLAGDPLVRQEIARLVEPVWSARWTAERAAAARASGRPPGPEGSLVKLVSSVIARQAARVHALIAGPHGVLAGPGSPRILGLPGEPDPSRNLPFREVPGGLSRSRRRLHPLPGLRATGWRSRLAACSSSVTRA